MRNTIIAFCFLIAFNSVYGQRKVTDNTEITLYTCGPGSELYSFFGHTCLGVHDSTTNLDFVFNFGLFSFSEDAFIRKFTQGIMMYGIGLDNYKEFYNEYLWGNQWVTAQKLNLTLSQKQKIWDALVTHYKKENRYYLYNYYTNNCATKVRDIIFDNIAVVHDSTELTGLSWRQYTTNYIGADPWASLGLNILLGKNSDTLITYYQAAFLPDFLSSYLTRTINVETNSVLAPIPEKILTANREPNNAHLVMKISLWAAVLVIFALTYAQVKLQLHNHLIDLVLLLIIGLIGLLITYMWFVSAHTITHYNYNYIWFNPIPLLLALLIPFKTRILKLKLFLTKVIIAEVIIGIFFRYLLPQGFPEGLTPILLISLSRLMYYHYQVYQKIIKKS